MPGTEKVIDLQEEDIWRLMVKLLILTMMVS